MNPMAFVGAGLGSMARVLPQRARLLRTTCPTMLAKKGDRVPLDVELMELRDGSPTGITAGDVFSGKKVALFTLPGALTPTCQSSHAPDWVAAAAALRAKGVDDVVCMSVNDPFVMAAFEKAVHGTDKVRFVADGAAKFATACGIDIDTGAFGGVRAYRGSYVVDDGVFVEVNLEEGKTSYDGPSKPETVLGQL